jgi:hypothetical protein
VLDAPDGAVGSIGVRAFPRAVADAPPWTVRAPGTDVRVPIPAAAWRGSDALALTIEALDEWGGSPVRTVLRLDQRSQPSAIREVDAVGSGDGSDSGFFSTPWPWVGLAVIVAAAATIAIVLATTTDVYDVPPPVVE